VIEQGRYNPILELAIKFSEFQKKEKTLFYSKESGKD
jgi:DNA-binding XRE family transcriptional regulator